MPTIELRFPAGRLHATPWGRHVNEGAVEWPPSPWRILRSLIATWHLKTQPAVTAETLRSLIHALSEKSPAFHLPRAGQCHPGRYPDAGFHDS
jgi:CRISPR-associated protein Csb2